MSLENPDGFGGNFCQHLRSPVILEFLQRRKLEANKAKHLCLKIVRAIILERRPLSMVSMAIDILLTAYPHAIKTGSYYKTTRAEESSNAVNENTGAHTSESSILPEPTRSIEDESYNRSMSSDSDSDDNGKRKPYGLDSSTGKSDKGNSVNTDTSSSQVDTPAGQSQDLGPGHDQLDSNVSGRQESTSAAISPVDMYSFVFSAVEEEMTGDGSYLISIIVEFLGRANSEKLKVYPNIYVLMVQVLARDERYAELGLFVKNKIIEPSKEVAMQLLESGRQNLHMRKLGLNMLRMLQLHHDYVLLLVQDGYYLEALRYARKFKVYDCLLSSTCTVSPAIFICLSFTPFIGALESQSSAPTAYIIKEFFYLSLPSCSKAYTSMAHAVYSVIIGKFWFTLILTSPRHPSEKQGQHCPAFNVSRGNLCF